MTTLSPENSLSARRSATFILEKRNPPIDKAEWDSFFDENGHLAKSRDFICINILERGLHPFVRTEAWKFLTGYYSWQSSRDERLMVDSNRRLPDYDWVAGSGAEAVFSLKAAPSQDVEDSSTGDQQRIVQDRQDVSVRPGRRQGCVLASWEGAERQKVLLHTSHGSFRSLRLHPFTLWFSGHMPSNRVCVCVCVCVCVLKTVVIYRSPRKHRMVSS
ncbi:TBC1 domain family member 21 isoform X1 [Mus musculus]|uniref:TBC1 domain family member 21 isoform X1 n=1 Tax=Mus musculus TaxID=10090 RepID=UPI0007ECDB71|nr:TBC1 domain family member 21 isoform X1 [Mus musculus]|eukprot:XP_017169155.1 PREDICTED: TBC1 domain family member 21 isoform X1 [Mus musculus]